MSESVRVKEMVTYRDVMHQKRFMIIFLVGLFLLLKGSFYVFFSHEMTQNGKLLTDVWLGFFFHIFRILAIQYLL